MAQNATTVYYLPFSFVSAKLALCQMLVNLGAANNMKIPADFFYLILLVGAVWLIVFCETFLVLTYFKKLANRAQDKFG